MLKLARFGKSFTKIYIASLSPTGGYASVIIQHSKVTVYLRLPIAVARRPPGSRMRDVAAIGHYRYRRPSTHYSPRIRIRPTRRVVLHLYTILID